MSRKGTNATDLRKYKFRLTPSPSLVGHNSLLAPFKNLSNQPTPISEIVCILDGRRCEKHYTSKEKESLPRNGEDRQRGDQKLTKKPSSRELRECLTQDIRDKVAKHILNFKKSRDSIGSKASERGRSHACISNTKSLVASRPISRASHYSEKRSPSRARPEDDNVSARSDAVKESSSTRIQGGNITGGGRDGGGGGRTGCGEEVTEEEGDSPKTAGEKTSKRCPAPCTFVCVTGKKGPSKVTLQVPLVPSNGNSIAVEMPNRRVAGSPKKARSSTKGRKQKELKEKGKRGDARKAQTSPPQLPPPCPVPAFVTFPTPTRFKHVARSSSQQKMLGPTRSKRRVSPSHPIRGRIPSARMRPATLDTQIASVAISENDVRLPLIAGPTAFMRPTTILERPERVKRKKVEFARSDRVTAAGAITSSPSELIPIRPVLRKTSPLIPPSKSPPTPPPSSSPEMTSLPPSLPPTPPSQRRGSSESMSVGSSAEASDASSTSGRFTLWSLVKRLSPSERPKSAISLPSVCPQPPQPDQPAYNSTPSMYSPHTTPRDSSISVHATSTANKQPDSITNPLDKTEEADTSTANAPPFKKDVSTLASVSSSDSLSENHPPKHETRVRQEPARPSSKRIKVKVTEQAQRNNYENPKIVSQEPSSTMEVISISSGTSGVTAQRSSEISKPPAKKRLLTPSTIRIKTSRIASADTAPEGNRDGRRVSTSGTPVSRSSQKTRTPYTVLKVSKAVTACLSSASASEIDFLSSKEVRYNSGESAPRIERNSADQRRISKSTSTKALSATLSSRSQSDTHLTLRKKVVNSNTRFDPRPRDIPHMTGLASSRCISEGEVSIVGGGIIRHSSDGSTAYRRSFRGLGYVRTATTATSGYSTGTTHPNGATRTLSSESYLPASLIVHAPSYRRASQSIDFSLSRHTRLAHLSSVSMTPSTQAEQYPPEQSLHSSRDDESKTSPTEESKTRTFPVSDPIPESAWVESRSKLTTRPASCPAPALTPTTPLTENESPNTTFIQKPSMFQKVSSTDSKISPSPSPNISKVFTESLSPARPFNSQTSSLPSTIVSTPVSSPEPSSSTPFSYCMQFPKSSGLAACVSTSLIPSAPSAAFLMAQEVYIRHELEKLIADVTKSVEELQEAARACLNESLATVAKASKEAEETRERKSNSASPTDESFNNSEAKQCMKPPQQKAITSMKNLRRKSPATRASDIEDSDLSAGDVTDSENTLMIVLREGDTSTSPEDSGEVVLAVESDDEADIDDLKSEECDNTDKEIKPLGYPFLDKKLKEDREKTIVQRQIKSRSSSARWNSAKRRKGSWRRRRPATPRSSNSRKAYYPPYTTTSEGDTTAATAGSSLDRETSERSSGGTTTRNMPLSVRTLLQQRWFSGAVTRFLGLTRLWRGKSSTSRDSSAGVVNMKNRVRRARAAILNGARVMAASSGLSDCCSDLDKRDFSGRRRHRMPSYSTSEASALTSLWMEKVQPGKYHRGSGTGSEGASRSNHQKLISGCTSVPPSAMPSNSDTTLPMETPPPSSALSPPLLSSPPASISSPPASISSPLSSPTSLAHSIARSSTFLQVVTPALRVFTTHNVSRHGTAVQTMNQSEDYSESPTVSTAGATVSQHVSGPRPMTTCCSSKDKRRPTTKVSDPSANVSGQSQRPATVPFLVERLMADLQHCVRWSTAQRQRIALADAAKQKQRRRESKGMGAQARTKQMSTSLVDVPLPTINEDSGRKRNTADEEGKERSEVLGRPPEYQEMYEVSPQVKNTLIRSSGEAVATRRTLPDLKTTREHSPEVDFKVRRYSSSPTRKVIAKPTFEGKIGRKYSSTGERSREVSPNRTKIFRDSYLTKLHNVHRRPSKDYCPNYERSPMRDLSPFCERNALRNIVQSSEVAKECAIAQEKHAMRQCSPSKDEKILRTHSPDTDEKTSRKRLIHREHKWQKHTTNKMCNTSTRRRAAHDAQISATLQELEDEHLDKIPPENKANLDHSPKGHSASIFKSSTQESFISQNGRSNLEKTAGKHGLFPGDHNARYDYQEERGCQIRKEHASRKKLHQKENIKHQQKERSTTVLNRKSTSPQKSIPSEDNPNNDDSLICESTEQDRTRPSLPSTSDLKSSQGESQILDSSSPDMLISQKETDTQDGLKGKPAKDERWTTQLFGDLKDSALSTITPLECTSNLWSDKSKLAMEGVKPLQTRTVAEALFKSVTSIARSTRRKKVTADSRPRAIQEVNEANPNERLKQRKKNSDVGMRRRLVVDSSAVTVQQQTKLSGRGVRRADALTDIRHSAVGRRRSESDASSTIASQDSKELEAASDNQTSEISLETQMSRRPPAARSVVAAAPRPLIVTSKPPPRPFTPSPSSLLLQTRLTSRPMVSTRPRFPVAWNQAHKNNCKVGAQSLVVKRTSAVPAGECHPRMRPTTQPISPSAAVTKALQKALAAAASAHTPFAVKAMPCTSEASVITPVSEQVSEPLDAAAVDRAVQAAIQAALSSVINAVHAEAPHGVNHKAENTRKPTTDATNAIAEVATDQDVTEVTKDALHSTDHGSPSNATLAARRSAMIQTQLQNQAHTQTPLHSISSELCRSTTGEINAICENNLKSLLFDCLRLYKLYADLDELDKALGCDTRNCTDDGGGERERRPHSVKDLPDFKVSFRRMSALNDTPAPSSAPCSNDTTFSNYKWTTADFIRPPATAPGELRIRQPLSCNGHQAQHK